MRVSMRLGVVCVCGEVVCLFVCVCVRACVRAWVCVRACVRAYYLSKFSIVRKLYPCKVSTDQTQLMSGHI